MHSDRLPSLRVFLTFPAVLLLFGIVVVGLGINGTSSGELFSSISAGKDPALIAGDPLRVRSDEWNVGNVWTIAQAAQNFPAVNRTFPGGMDAALPYDLPRHEWSMAFRPHLLGFLFLDVGHATAWRWWVGGLALIAAAWALMISILPRRPVVAAALSVGFFFSPFIQWWFQSTTLWPLTWALTTMAALVWLFKRQSTVSSVAWSAIVAYLTVVMAMGIYAPFIVPVIIIVLFFAVGLTVGALRSTMSVRRALLAATPVIAAGAGASAIVGFWLHTKSATVQAFLDTAYPGLRLTPTGEGTPLSVLRLLGAAFSESLKRTAGFLGLNSSEASTFFLVGLFLLPVVGWLIYRAAKARSALPWELIGLSAGVTVLLAFMLVPGWDPIAHLLYLDRTTADRTRIGVGLASFAILGYVICALDDRRQLAQGQAAGLTTGHTGALSSGLTSLQPVPGAVFSGLIAALFLVSQVGITWAVVHFIGFSKLWAAAPFWLLVVLASAATIFFFSRGRVALATAGFLAITVFSSAAVNPVYSGVLDLRTTAASQGIVRANVDKPGKWLSIGGPIVNNTLIESGMVAYNGTQGAPSRTMWRQIDPGSKYADSWNRLGGVNWQNSPGEPVVTTPFADQIMVTFDACSLFAQKNVSYLFTDVATTSACLEKVESFPTPARTQVIYRVIKNPQS